jgi:RNA-dependent RNA polymerase
MELEPTRFDFEVVMGKSLAGCIHYGKAALRLLSMLWSRLLRWYKGSDEHSIVVNGRALELFKTDNPVPLDVKQELEKALYIDPDQDKIRTQIEERSSQVRLRVAKVQFGVWYKPSDSTDTRRSFSVEYERNFLYKSAANLYLVCEHRLICIDVSVTLLPI